MKKSLKRGRQYKYLYFIKYQTNDGEIVSVISESLKEIKSINMCQSLIDITGDQSLDCDAKVIDISFVGKRRIK